MTPTGWKIFHVTRRIPKDFRGDYLKDVKKTFEKVCAQVLHRPHKIYVTCQDTKNGRTYSFSVVFGQRQFEKIPLQQIIQQLANIALWEMTLSVLQKKIPSTLDAMSEKYQKYCEEGIKNRVKVKPNEHVRLC